ncbi:uncharacterized protein NPIL_563441 [Nephila pilipes]|uniref:Uncharacterized protein n=1 Tax=Nephila pilipes TaxID=299642 RepID=A0A8X6U6F0_NEPPI|nr:uncharacterized protein NPIL_563441 [Nephila pilipes]
MAYFKAARNRKNKPPKLCSEPFCKSYKNAGRLNKRTISNSDSIDENNNEQSTVTEMQTSDPDSNVLARELDSRRRVSSYNAPLTEKDPEIFRAEIFHEHAVGTTELDENMRNSPFEEMPSLKREVGKNIRPLRRRKQIDEVIAPNLKTLFLTTESHPSKPTLDSFITLLPQTSTAQKITTGSSDSEGMHLVKLVYKVKEEELDSIFGNANDSLSTANNQEPLTTPSLEDAVKMQNSMIKQMLKAMNNKRKQQFGTANKKTISLQKNKVSPIERLKNTKIVNSKVTNPAPISLKVTNNKYNQKEIRNYTSRSIMLNNFQKSLPQLQNLYNILTKLKHGGGVAPLGANKAELESSLLSLLKGSGALNLLAEEARKFLTTPSTVTPTLLELLEMALFKYADLLKKNEKDNKNQLGKGLEEKVVGREMEDEINKTSYTTQENQFNWPRRELQYALMTTRKSISADDEKVLNKSARVLEQLSTLYHVMKNHPSAKRNDSSGRKVRDSASRLARSDETEDETAVKDTTNDLALDSGTSSDNSVETDNGKEVRDLGIDEDGSSRIHLRAPAASTEDNDEETDADDLIYTETIPESSSLEETTLLE